MKLCPDRFDCPYQSTFDVLWRREAVDPGFCEYYYGQPDSKCPHPLSKAYEQPEEDQCTKKF